MSNMNIPFCWDFESPVGHKDSGPTWGPISTPQINKEKPILTRCQAVDSHFKKIKMPTILRKLENKQDDIKKIEKEKHFHMKTHLLADRLETHRNLHDEVKSTL